MKEFVWNILEIQSQLEDIHSVWARLLGITEPQWLMLMAIMDLDEDMALRELTSPRSYGSTLRL
ncbi:hypothetical protein GGD66_008015 [Bradyrhizobium sp. CIR48]|uniref:hypothetical protein n=1 Tax=unclassified Bradyrhizobium TaxID=2631580 RepID=UPI0017956080|nr:MULTISPECIES: hypothetical protein [unclassified Bradyrhizobium]MBB4366910.1 hypothetical protein [Bradyrhizobium sp. CIR18]MBB4429413.1 hypothetical protein [Bradyrhizobium sp. CIR48]